LEEQDGFPKLILQGSEEDYNFMAMDLLGPSLEDLFYNSGKQFSLQTVLMLADQMVQTILTLLDLPS